MPMHHRTVLTLACLAAACAAASGHAQTRAANGAELTLYRSDSATLYASGGDGQTNDGYALVHEQRPLDLSAGTQDVSIGNLPLYLDAEALALAFPDGSAKVLSQRLLIGQGNNAALAGLVGRPVDVLGSNGQSLAAGTLLRAGAGLLVQGSGGQTTLIRDYAAVRTQGADFATGSSLRLRIDAARAGHTNANLSYATGGMGWRAAYVGSLLSGGACRMVFESRASIANRSGHDWNNVQLKLVAGEPQFAKPSAPQPMQQARAFSAKAESAGGPEQSTLADYRMYRLPAAFDLPDGSVSQLPLYATRTLDCERTALYETGGNWQPPQPMLDENFSPGGDDSIISTLAFNAFDSLPAGYLRVLAADHDGTPQFIGEGRIDDTPKGSEARITLGTAFDLRATRERTAFKIDQVGRSLDESFRITLSNASDTARAVTVREHPNRWREWTLVSSSGKPAKQTPDTLEFRIEVPAAGKAMLDYAVRYHWTAEQQAR